MVGLERLSGSWPVSTSREFIAADGQFDFEDTGYVLEFPDDESRAQAIDMLELASLPASPVTLTRGLLRLCVVSAGPRRGEMDQECYIAAMIEELEEYPADVALDGLKAMRRQLKWLPTASEIHEFCGWRAQRRERLRQAARVALVRE